MRVLALLIFLIYSVAGLASQEAIARLEGCSGSIVKFEGSSSDKNAILLTNDHCIYDQEFGKYFVDLPINKIIKILNREGRELFRNIRAKKIIYATQTDTDIALLELNISYQELESLFKVRAFVLSKTSAQIGDIIEIPSGLWKESHTCEIKTITPVLQEGEWVWKNSYGYFCQNKNGASGSPLVLKGTRTVIGVNNTAHEGNGDCSDEPCELEAGVQVGIQNKSYGQQIKNLYTCLDGNKDFDIKTPGCNLLGGDSRVN